MRKFVYLLLILLSTVMFARCMSSEKSVKFKPYKTRDYIRKEIRVYEVKEWLHPTLDSILVETEECLEGKGYKDKVVFTFNIVGELTSSGKFADFAVEGFYSSESINHAIETEAVFYYKGYTFYCGGTFLDLFFRETSKTITLTCIDPEKFRHRVDFENTTLMEWLYMQHIE